MRRRLEQPGLNRAPCKDALKPARISAKSHKNQRDSRCIKVCLSPPRSITRADGETTCMLPYDVILFDVGGVLLTNGWDHGERAAAIEAFQIDKDDFERRHADIDGQWERGEITMEAYLDVTVFHQPRSFSRDDFAAFIFNQSKILPSSGLGSLQQLASGGRYLVGALNNEARETNEFRFETFGLRNYFKIALSSCYLGLRKPDEAIYRRALDILGVPPHRILFIDDREENIAPAGAIGMATIHFKGASELQAKLTKEGVL